MDSLRSSIERIKKSMDQTVESGKTFSWHVTAFVIFVLLKFAYSFAGNNELYFLLGPTDLLVSVFTGSGSVYIADSGYYYSSFNIILGRSCSGFNFWVLCFIMLTYLSLRFLKDSNKKIYVIPASLLIAYVLTIFANVARVIVSITGQKAGDLFIVSRPHHLLHEAIGFFIYLFLLITIYLAFDTLLKKLTVIHAKLT